LFHILRDVVGWRGAIIVFDCHWLRSGHARKPNISSMDEQLSTWSACTGQLYCRAPELPRGESGRGQPHSKTLSRHLLRIPIPRGRGVRLSSAAFSFDLNLTSFSEPKLAAIFPLPHWEG